jgi:hypothetical protein
MVLRSDEGGRIEKDEPEVKGEWERGEGENSIQDL